MKKKPLIAVVGPTASGKSALAFYLAKQVDGEIVAMDSMQVYQQLNIGTAKASKKEQEEIPHHLIDVVSPWEEYSVSQYREKALKSIEEIFQRGKQPILVGGTGLYYQSILQPIQLGHVGKNEGFRKTLEKIGATEDGKKELHRLLQEKDMKASEKIHKNDVKRVIRALEVIESTGELFSAQRGLWKEDSPYKMQSFAVHWPREILYQRINHRVDQMMKEGLLEEVEGLIKEGVPSIAQSMQGIGYKELVPVLAEGSPLEEALEKLKQSTRKYGKRQITWFKRYEHITWLEPDTMEEDAINKIKKEIVNATEV